jgi:hypothetical protein
VFCRLLAIYEYLSVAKYIELKRAEDDRRRARSLSRVPEWDWREPAAPLPQPAAAAPAAALAAEDGNGSAPAAGSESRPASEVAR